MEPFLKVPDMDPNTNSHLHIMNNSEEEEKGIFIWNIILFKLYALLFCLCL
jgi:hypothetical protein